jgi:hypothetical protein
MCMGFLKGHKIKKDNTFRVTLNSFNVQDSYPQALDAAQPVHPSSNSNEQSN